MPLIYRDKLRLDAHEMELLPGIEEFLTGNGYVADITIYPERQIEGVIFPREAHVAFEFAAYTDEPDDLWTMCERANEIHDELASHGVNWHPDRANVKRVKRIDWQ